MIYEDIKTKVVQAVTDARKIKPLSSSITNTVTINFVANTQIAAGGSAAMVYLPDEGEALAKVSNSFYINMGTMFPIYEETLPLTAKTLADRGKPWVLDPVAVGIGELRSKILKQFKEYKPNIIRGNASEIIALAGLWNLQGGSESKVRGVDATQEVESARQAAETLAKFTGGAVAVSGIVDLVTNGNDTIYAYGGSVLMEKITGAGCSLGGVMGVYAAVTDPFSAALTGTMIYNEAGRKAEQEVAGPGSFIPAFIDNIYNLTAEEVSESKIKMGGRE